MRASNIVIAGRAAVGSTSARAEQTGGMQLETLILLLMASLALWISASFLLRVIFPNGNILTAAVANLPLLIALISFFLLFLLCVLHLGFYLSEFTSGAAKTAREMRTRQKLFENTWRLHSCKSVAFDPKSGKLTIELSDGARLVAEALVVGLSSLNRETGSWARIRQRGREYSNWVWIWDWGGKYSKVPEILLVRYRDPDRVDQLLQMLRELKKQGKLRCELSTFTSKSFGSAFAPRLIDLLSSECARVMGAEGQHRFFESHGEDTFEIAVLLKSPKWSNLSNCASSTAVA